MVPVAVPTIRQAVIPADAEGLACVYVSSAAHHARLDPSFYRVPTLDAVTARYRSGPAGTRPDLLVAELSSQIIGMARLTELTPPSPASMVAPLRTASVDVAVLETHRGQGVGTLLMEAVEHAAHAEGIQRLMLDAAAANDRALHFYRAELGYRDHGVFLRKDLQADPDTNGERT